MSRNGCLRVTRTGEVRGDTHEQASDPDGLRTKSRWACGNALIWKRMNLFRTASYEPSLARRDSVFALILRRFLSLLAHSLQQNNSEGLTRFELPSEGETTR